MLGTRWAKYPFSRTHAPCAASPRARAGVARLSLTLRAAPRSVSMATALGEAVRGYGSVV